MKNFSLRAALFGAYGCCKDTTLIDTPLYFCIFFGVWWDIE